MLRKSLFSFRFEDAAVEAAWQQARLPQFKRHNTMAALMFIVISAIFVVVDFLVVGSNLNVLGLRALMVGLGVILYIAIATTASTWSSRPSGTPLAAM